MYSYVYFCGGGGGYCTSQKKYTVHRCVYRELDMDVFCVLHVKLINRASLDSDENTAAEERIQLQPQQLLYLLHDLHDKLAHALPTSAVKRVTFLKVR